MQPLRTPHVTAVIVFGRGLFRLRSYRYYGTKVVMRNGERVSEPVQEEPVVIYRGEVSGKEGVLVRVHDQCFTSEVMHVRARKAPHRSLECVLESVSPFR